MKLDGLRFRNLGAFDAMGVAVEGLRPGLNVIAERNERGKSSLLAGLELLLFANHKATGKVVQTLTRDDGASPEGEIDFTYDGRAFRLIKRFRSGKTAELLDRASGQVIARRGEAEERLAEMLGATGKAHGPSGLLWVRQGTSMDGVSDDGHVAARLETELSTLVGGDRARDYLAKVEAQLGALRTANGRPKKHGPIDLASQALDTAREERDAAERLARETRETSRALADVETHLQRLQTTVDPAQTQAELKAAREALTQARAAQSDQQAAEAKAQRLALEAKAATESLGRFLEQCADYDRWVGAQDALAEQLRQLAQDQTQAITARDAAQSALDGLYGAQQQALRQAQYEQDRERLVEKNAVLNALAETLDALTTLETERDTLVAERDAMPAIMKADLDALFALERQRGTAHAEQARLAVPLVFKAADEGERSVTLDGKALRSGPFTLKAGAELKIDGVGTLRLDHPDTDRLDRELERIDAEIAAWYDRFGVDDVKAAAAQMEQRATLDHHLKTLSAELRAKAPNGKDTLLDRQVQLNEEVNALRARVEEAEAELGVDNPAALSGTEDISAQLAAATGQVQAAQTRLSEIEHSQATLTERQKAGQQHLSLLPDTATPDKREAHKASLASAAAKADARMEDAQTVLAALQAKAHTDPAMIEAKIKRLTNMETNRASEREALLIRKAQLETRRRDGFEQRDPDAEVQRLSGMVDRLEDELARHEREADALTLLRETLIESQRSLRDHYTAPVRKELLPLLRQVIDGADLVLSEQLGATGLVRDGQDDVLERLSGGTREQIAVLTRLAFARLLTRGGQPCPVILDDALVYADDARRARMFDVLNYVASGDDGLQLIYLSCHETATAQLAGHPLQLTTWPQS